MPWITTYNTLSLHNNTFEYTRKDNLLHLCLPSPYLSPSASCLLCSLIFQGPLRLAERCETQTASRHSLQPEKMTHSDVKIISHVRCSVQASYHVSRCIKIHLSHSCSFYGAVTANFSPQAYLQEKCHTILALFNSNCSRGYKCQELKFRKRRSFRVSENGSWKMLRKKVFAKTSTNMVFLVFLSFLFLIFKL